MYDDDRDALAAEYVLGTLSGDERDQAEALLVIDPGFAEIVRVWERRLGELNVMVEAVEPPPELWDKISTEIGGEAWQDEAKAKAQAAFPSTGDAAPQTAPTFGMTPDATSEPDLLPGSAKDPDMQYLDLSEPPRDLDEPRTLDEASVVAALASSLLPPEPAPESAKRPPPLVRPLAAPPKPKIEQSADIVYLTRQTRRWRGFTVAMSAIAALLAIYVGVEQFAPGLIPASRQPQTVAAGQTRPAGPRLVAVLQHEPTAPAFLLTVELQDRTLTVRRLTGAPDADRSYELWLIPNQSSAPRSLGLVGNQEFTTRPLPADFNADALRTASYAVSLEPAGGSTKGAPTGPILFTGNMVEALPGSPPG
jgi:anti-sigma-K factor RskA